MKATVNVSFIGTATQHFFAINYPDETTKSSHGERAAITCEREHRMHGMSSHTVLMLALITWETVTLPGVARSPCRPARG